MMRPAAVERCDVQRLRPDTPFVQREVHWLITVSPRHTPLKAVNRRGGLANHVHDLDAIHHEPDTRGRTRHRDVVPGVVSDGPGRCVERPTVEPGSERSIGRHTERPGGRVRLPDIPMAATASVLPDESCNRDIVANAYREHIRVQPVA